MVCHKVIVRLLKIKECRLIDVSFHPAQLVRLYVKPFKNGRLCPDCGRRGTIIRPRPQAREWRDLKVGGWHIGIDEILFKKGNKHCTLVYDLDCSKIFWIGLGKGRQCIDQFFNTQLSNFQKNQIQAGCCDICDAYVGAIKLHCPNATLAIDRFHIVKALNEAVDNVRKEQWCEASKEDRKLFKGMRWMLFRHSSTRTRQHTRSLTAMEKYNRRIYRAWQLKEEFEAFWDYKAPWAAERFLKGWLTRCLKSRLEPLRRFVGTVRKHMDTILAFISTRLTNVISEGLNRVAKMVKDRASGFRDLPPFADLIMLVIGDVNIPAQIPTKFHTV